MFKFTVTALVALSAAGTAALGQPCDPNTQTCIHAVVYSGGNIQDFTYQPSASSINVPLAATTTLVKLYVTPIGNRLLTDMPRVQLTGGSTNTVVGVFLGTGSFEDTDVHLSSVCRDW